MTASAPDPGVPRRRPGKLRSRLGKRPNDKSVGGGANIIKRITGNQGEDLIPAGIPLRATAGPEQPGGGANIIKRITGNQGEDLIPAGIQLRDTVGPYDPGGYDAITVVAEQRGERNDVVPPDVSKRPEERVAVPGNTDVPRLTR